MGAPVDPAPAGVIHDNPAGTNGLAFVEFSAPRPADAADLFRRLGFREVGRLGDAAVTLWRQGGIDFLINAAPDSHAVRFAAAHGPCISALAFRVADGAQAMAHALARGATAYAGDRGAGVVPGKALIGIGDSLLHLLGPREEAAFKQGFASAGGLAEVEGVGFLEVDHLTHNVVAGGLDRWAGFYRDVFNFREVFYLDARGSATGFRTRAMMSPCGRICIPVNEPTDPKSQIQEYIDQYGGEGVQHIALRCADLNASMEALASSDIPTQPIPSEYYAGIDARLPGHGHDVARLERNGILIDGDRDGEAAPWRLLLQIFTRNLLGPAFFEFIERRGASGFGEGNAKALFEAIERDQIRRGVVRAG